MKTVFITPTTVFIGTITGFVGMMDHPEILRGKNRILVAVKNKRDELRSISSFYLSGGNV